MRSSSGNRFLRSSRYSDGMSFRAVRSPEAPKMTSVSGIDMCCPLSLVTCPCPVRQQVLRAHCTMVRCGCPSVVTRGGRRGQGTRDMSRLFRPSMLVLLSVVLAVGAAALLLWPRSQEIRAAPLRDDESEIVWLYSATSESSWERF